jgi:hypothetical protein
MAMHSSWLGIFLKFGDFWNLPLLIWEKTRRTTARKTKKSRNPHISEIFRARKSLSAEVGIDT